MTEREREREKIENRQRKKTLRHGKDERLKSTKRGKDQLMNEKLASEID